MGVHCLAKALSHEKQILEREAIIMEKQHRNHPSVFQKCWGNECSSLQRKAVVFSLGGKRLLPLVASLEAEWVEEAGGCSFSSFDHLLDKATSGEEVPGETAATGGKDCLGLLAGTRDGSPGMMEDVGWSGNHPRPAPSSSGLGMCQQSWNGTSGALESSNLEDPL